MPPAAYRSLESTARPASGSSAHGSLVASLGLRSRTSGSPATPSTRSSCPSPRSGQVRPLPIRGATDPARAPMEPVPCTWNSLRTGPRLATGRGLPTNPVAVCTLYCIDFTVRGLSERGHTSGSIPTLPALPLGRLRHLPLRGRHGLAPRLLEFTPPHTRPRNRRINRHQFPWLRFAGRPHITESFGRAPLVGRTARGL